MGLNIYSTIYKIHDQQKPTVSIGNYTHCFVIIYNGKKSEKEIDVYGYVTELLFCTPEANTTL